MPKIPPRIWEQTVERRTVLQWLGSSAVLALSGGVLAACDDLSGATESDGGEPGSDGGAMDGDVIQPDGSLVDGGSTVVCQDGTVNGDFPFQPGPVTDSLFSTWGERTVDPQNLNDILASWRLTVDGLVDYPKVFGFADLVCLPRQDQVTDFHCVEGWSVYDVPWNGVHLSELVDRVRPTSAATHITLYSLGGKYVESLPLEVALEPKTLLAYGIQGSTIPMRHGFPLRMVVPHLWGYKSIKGLARMTFNDHVVAGYWESRGYTECATIEPGITFDINSRTRREITGGEVTDF